MAKESIGSCPGLPGTMQGDIKTPMSSHDVKVKGGTNGKVFKYKDMPKADKSGSGIYGPGTKAANFKK